MRSQEEVVAARTKEAVYTNLDSPLDEAAKDIRLGAHRYNPILRYLFGKALCTRTNGRPLSWVPEGSRAVPMGHSFPNTTRAVESRIGAS